MAKQIDTWWQRNKYLLSGLLLVLSAWYYYQSLNPSFPPALPASQVGQFQISVMPYNEQGPYQHDGQFVKDFLLIFKEGKISDIRQGYLNIGSSPLPLETLQQGDLGILHGSRHGQHVHALTHQQFTHEDKIWLTLELWNGEQLSSSWELPKLWK